MSCIILSARHGLALKFVIVLRRGRADYYSELPSTYQIMLFINHNICICRLGFCR
jgi:hypothetical protein